RVALSLLLFFFSSRRRHTRFSRDWSSDVCSSDLFVRAIIEVARGMGKLTVAEFVEDEATLQMLREMGVDMVQGYHLGRPRADHRSEERRVGKECRSRWWPCH